MRESNTKKVYIYMYSSYSVIASIITQIYLLLHEHIQKSVFDAASHKIHYYNNYYMLLFFVYVYILLKSAILCKFFRLFVALK